MGGAGDWPAFSVSPSFRSGWRTDDSQSTRALPEVCPRTTVSSDAYEKLLLFPLYVTVASAVNGTVAPAAVPGVSFTSLMCASSR